MEQLQELIQQRDVLAFSMIEADGDEYYELSKQLEEIEEKIQFVEQTTGGKNAEQEG